jgi:hypothetical protein
MKKLLICLAILSSQAQADVILSAVVKDGPNGYSTSGSSTTTTSTSTTKSPNSHWPFFPSSTSTSTNTNTSNNVDVTNRVQADLGLRLEYMTKESPIVVSIEGFQDTTVAASIGVRLW